MTPRPMLEEVDTPAVIVDLAVMEANLRRMAALCQQHGVALRPHIKTHKTPEIARQQLELGAIGITVAKLGEAEVMAVQGFSDILIAYELVGDRKMQRLVDLLTTPRSTPLRLTMAIDSIEGATALSSAATRANIRLPVLIELNTGLGRTGVDSLEEAVSLARHIRLFPGLWLDGVITHEGHAGKDGPGSVAGRSADAAALMRETLAAIQALGLECKTISVGSTPSARYIVREAGITELRPGTYVFNDRTQISVEAAREEDCAATILSTVVSVHPGRRVILDAGSKTLTSDAVQRFGDYGLILEDPEARLAVCTEEHGHVDISRSQRAYKVGDRVHVLPNHICPTVNLAERLYAYRGAALEHVWTVAARGKVQ